MAGKQEVKKRIRWKHRSKDVASVIEKSSEQVWISRCNKFLKKCGEKKRLPTISRFYKEQGLWIYWLRDAINKGSYKDRKDLLEKYDIVKRIISSGRAEDIINRNINTGTFAIALMQNENEWNKEQGKVPTAITFNLTNFQLPSADAPQPPVPGPQSPITIDCEVIGPLDDKQSLLINPPNEQGIGVDEQANVDCKVKKGGSPNSENVFVGSSACRKYTPSRPSPTENSQPTTDKDFTDDYDTLPIPIKPKPTEKEDVEVQTEIFEKDIFFEEEE